MGKVVKTIIGAVMTVVGFVTGQPTLVVQGLGMVFSTLAEKKQKNVTNAATEQRLSKSLVPETPRKIVFGKTAVPLDIRFWEVYGANKTNYVEVFAVATHPMTSFGRLWIEDTEVTFSGDNATGAFAGVLKRYTKLKGLTGAGMSLGSGTQWTTNASMTGCAYFVLDWAWNQEKLPQGIPTKIVQEGEGAPVYDPRRDVSLGGTHLMTDQSTWQYSPLDSNSVPIGRNNALQMISYLLGYKINGKLAGGRGVLPANINAELFITAANDCEVEGWYSDCVLSTGDSHSTNEAILENAAGGKLTDTGGLWGYRVSRNDTANIAIAATEHDVIGDVSWNPRKPLTSQYNVVGGSFIDVTALYQPSPYPAKTNATYVSDDGREITLTQDFQAVQDNVQAQKLAFRKLQEGRRQGIFRSTFNWKPLLAENLDCMTLTYPPLGFVDKLFRIVEMSLAPTGIELTLQETGAEIFTTDTILPYTPPSAALGFDPALKVNVTNLIVTASSTGSNSNVFDALLISWDDPGARCHHTEIRYKVTGATYWSESVIVGQGQISSIIDGLLSNTAYSIEVRHISIDNVPGNWQADSETTSALTTSSATPQSTGNLLHRGRFEDQFLGRWVFVTPAGRTFGSPSGMPFNTSLLLQNTSGKEDIEIPVLPGETLFLSCYSLPLTSSTTHIGIECIDDLHAVISSTSEILSTNSAAWTWKEVSIVVPANTAFVKIKLNTESTSGHYAHIMANRTQTGADVTSSSTPSLSSNVSVVNIEADYQGTVISGQLPKTVNCTRKRGDIDVSASTTWSIVSAPSMTCSIASDGILSITAIANTGTALIRSVRDGVTLEIPILVNKNLAAPPSGGGGTTVSDTSFTGITTASHVAISNEMTVHTGASGQIAFSADLSFTFSSGTNSYEGCYAKWEWKAVGGSYADVATEVAHHTVAYEGSNGGAWEPDEDGGVTCSPTKTGLSANTDYVVRLLARRTDTTPAGTIDFSGSAIAVGS